jgi:two-component system, chemotaxis family, sensor kinase CheA
VRVNIDKIDGLIDLVGELVITQSMLDQFEQFEREDFDADRLALLRQGLAQLARHTRLLQESVMGIRMLPIGAVFSRFPRMVRDLSQKLGKQVKLELVGEQTELDKTVMEKIGDPLVHLVRNAIDHGLEQPERRRAAGKAETGTLRLEASHRGGSIVVEISDDGAGLNREAIVAKAIQRGLIASGEKLSDEEVAELIFQPGFSTAAVTTDLSGRGVGMDVVRRNVTDLGGSVGIRSTPGKGSVFTITLPLTLAIIDGLTAAVGEERYIVPLMSIVESVQLRAEQVRTLAGGGELFRFRDAYLPVIRLHEVFGCSGARSGIAEGLVIVVESEGGQVGLFVDELIGQQQAVIKSLEANYRRVGGISGATILADGSVALIVDIAGLVRMQGRRKAA